MPDLSSTPQENFLIHNLLLFSRLLRAAGIDSPPYRTGEVLQAFEQIDLSNRQDVFYTLRSLLVYDHADYPIFKKAFREFWKAWQNRWLSMSLPPVKAPLQPQMKADPGTKTLSSPPRRSSDTDSLPASASLSLKTTYSPTELLRQKDFAQLTPEEIRAVYHLIESLEWSPAERKTRRFSPGGADQLDFHLTFRENLRFGSELVLLRHKTPRFKPRPIIILADVSGSMQDYSKILMHFVFSITAKSSQPVESFIFNTRLTRITPHISLPRFEHAMQALSESVHSWSGGTRIGAALRTFNIEWAWRLNAQSAAILLISDGWDRGNPEDLKREIAHLQRCAHQLIWLNPLLGSPDYQPLTRGMQAALPHLDRFLPAHNLASLEQLAEILTAGLKRSIPIRQTAQSEPQVLF